MFVRLITKLTFSFITCFGGDWKRKMNTVETEQKIYKLTFNAYLGQQIGIYETVNKYLVQSCTNMLKKLLEILSANNTMHVYTNKKA